MSHRLRYVAIASILAIPTLATAQSPADKAEKLNDEGKAFWNKKDFPSAAEKFRQATLLSPQAKYFFNLCYALHQSGKYREAITECEKVETAEGTNDKLRRNATIVIDDASQKVASAPDDPYQTDPGPDQTDPGPDQTVHDPDTPDNPDNPDNNPDIGPGPDGTGQVGNDPGINPPPAPIAGLYQPAEIPDDYKWAVGIDVGVHGSNIGNSDFHTGAGVKVKGFLDFMWLPQQRIGVQGYVSFASITAKDDFGEGLQVVDLGGAVYKHIKRNRFYITPLFGVHLSAIQLENSFNDQGAFTVGVRGEAAISWLVGPSRRHVLSVTPGLNLYLPADGDEMTVAAGDLDQSATSFSVTIGYTLRFTTPFGQSSLITLE